MRMDGNIWVRTSYTARAIKQTSVASQPINNSHEAPISSTGQNRYEQTNSTAVESSNSGSKRPIGFLQYLHFPFSDSQLYSGIRSFAVSSCPQCIHMLLLVNKEYFFSSVLNSFFLLPFSSSVFCKRHTTAPIKLPKIKPNVKRIKQIKTLILKSIS